MTTDYNKYTGKASFFHIHIPKTGGSALNEYLKDEFKHSFVHENAYLSTVHYSKDQIREMINFYNIQCYAGHVFNLANVPFSV